MRKGLNVAWICTNTKEYYTKLEKNSNLQLKLRFYFYSISVLLMRRKCFWVSFPHCLFCLIEFHFLISSHNFMSTCCSMGLDVVLSFLCSFVCGSTSDQNHTAVEEPATRPANPKQVTKWRKVFKHKCVLFARLFYLLLGP